VGVIDALVEACGAEHARAAGPTDAVGGVLPGWVAAPADTDELGAVLRIAADEGLAVVPSGAGTKIDWGVPPTHLDLLIEVGRLAGVYDHAPDELTATIGAGTPMRAVRAVLARAGQRLALDVGSPGATLGGVIATQEAGPLRLSFGPPSDLVLAVRAMLADGSLVNTVPGHELARLLCGSFGTLGVIAEATMRLQPAPAARAWVVRPVSTPREVHELTAALLSSSFLPAAIEADLPGGARPSEFAVLVEGSSANAVSRAEAVARILGGGAAVDDGPPDWWGRYPFDGDDIALRVAAPSAELFAVIYTLRDAAGVSVPVRGSSGTGIAYAALPGRMPPERVDGVLTAARATLLGRGGGSCTVLRAPPEVRAMVDSYGPVPAQPAARRAKLELDPDGRFAPGRQPLVD
jgi:glycolate oxidase FAD binding subunit